MKTYCTEKYNKIASSKATGILLCKQDVAGSTPVASTKFSLFSASYFERLFSEAIRIASIPFCSFRITAQIRHTVRASIANG